MCIPDSLMQVLGCDDEDDEEEDEDEEYVRGTRISRDG
jgi:ribosome assembly protein YihI (activator of Der GTPase)